MTDCVIGSALTSAGYPSMRHGGQTVLTHRQKWETLHGLIPKGMHLHHQCGNRACVNVEHLELVTPREHKARHAEPLSERCTKCGSDDWYVFYRANRDIHERQCRACARSYRRERYARDSE